MIHLYSRTRQIIRQLVSRVQITNLRTIFVLFVAVLDRSLWTRERIVFVKAVIITRQEQTGDQESAHNAATLLL